MIFGGWGIALAVLAGIGALVYWAWKSGIRVNWDYFQR